MHGIKRIPRTKPQLPCAHGGGRKGAGRKRTDPSLKKTARSIKLPEWLWLWIDAQPNTNRALLIEDAITQVHGDNLPKD